jgi:TolA-binding protein
MSQHHASLSYAYSALQIASRLLIVFFASTSAVTAQNPTDENLAIKVQQLTDAINQTQQALEHSQRELAELRTQLTALRQQITDFHGAEAASSSASQLNAAVEQIREQQSLQETQIATHEQSKVETESKYPVKLNGLVLLTGFVNTTRVDSPVTPSVAVEGGGNTGISMQQTVLGFDARGPHLFGARTSADARVDFYGAPSSSGSNAYSGNLLRLRTAHALLDWNHTEAFFSLDRPIIAPHDPTSLTAVALPALAWSGNLWSWNPQFGITQDLAMADSRRLRIQAALIDVADPSQVYASSAVTSGVAVPSTAEMSRWPGAEGRLAFLNGEEASGLQLGLGGFFAPHRTVGGTRFNSWSGTLDYRIPLPGRAEISGSAYGGQALGGLGGGAFKDYVFNYSPLTGYSFRTLHDVGGWTQLKERATGKLEFNLAFGTDQVPASQLRPYAGAPSAYYLNLARNRTYTANAIYSPSAYLLFSLEYRHILSSPVNDYTASGDVIGIATGYRC